MMLARNGKQIGDMGAGIGDADPPALTGQALTYLLQDGDAAHVDNLDSGEIERRRMCRAVGEAVLSRGNQDRIEQFRGVSVQLSVQPDTEISVAAWMNPDFPNQPRQACR